MTVLVLATGNPGKLREIQPYLQGLSWELKLKPQEIEVDEVGTTFAENAALKASQVAIVTGNWAIADDSGLEVTALNNAPGIFSARYGSSDRDRIDRLLRELANRTDRAARFVCAIAVARPDGAIAVQTEGRCPGEILTAPRGESGFGYDPIFYVPEKGLTFAEMSTAIKHEVSHRGRAFQALLPQLKALEES